MGQSRTQNGWGEQGFDPRGIAPADVSVRVQALPAKKPKPVADGGPKPKAKRAPKAAPEGEGGADGKKKRKKKDPNAPKGALSAFMFFSQARREQVRTAGGCASRTHVQRRPLRGS